MVGCQGLRQAMVPGEEVVSKLARILQRETDGFAWRAEGPPHYPTYMRAELSSSTGDFTMVCCERCLRSGVPHIHLTPCLGGVRVGGQGLLRRIWAKEWTTIMKTDDAALSLRRRSSKEFGRVEDAYPWKP